MGAINFNPAQVLARLSRERFENSRIAGIAGSHPKIHFSAPTAEPRNPANLLSDEPLEKNRKFQGVPAIPAIPAILLNYVTPVEWLKGLATLDPNQPPTHFPALWWRGLIRDSELFLATWGSQAADLGWTTLDLFGVHPKAPAARYSCMGLLLLLRGGRVVALTTSTAVIEQQSGARLTYTRQPPEAECVPVWELPHPSQERPTAAATRTP
jgi:hypothetical protein